MIKQLSATMLLIVHIGAGVAPAESADEEAWPSYTCRLHWSTYWCQGKHMHPHIGSVLKSSGIIACSEIIFGVL